MGLGRPQCGCTFVGEDGVAIGVHHRVQGEGFLEVSLLLTLFRRHLLDCLAPEFSVSRTDRVETIGKHPQDRLGVVAETGDLVGVPLHALRCVRESCVKLRGFLLVLAVFRLALLVGLKDGLGRALVAFLRGIGLCAKGFFRILGLLTETLFAFFGQVAVRFGRRLCHEFVGHVFQSAV